MKQLLRWHRVPPPTLEPSRGARDFRASDAGILSAYPQLGRDPAARGHRRAPRGRHRPPRSVARSARYGRRDRERRSNRRPRDDECSHRRRRLRHRRRRGYRTRARRVAGRRHLRFFELRRPTDDERRAITNGDLVRLGASSSRSFWARTGPEGLLQRNAPTLPPGPQPSPEVTFADDDDAAILLVGARDRPGLLATITTALTEAAARIVDSEIVTVDGPGARPLSTDGGRRHPAFGAKTRSHRPRRLGCGRTSRGVAQPPPVLSTTDSLRQSSGKQGALLVSSHRVGAVGHRERLRRGRSAVPARLLDDADAASNQRGIRDDRGLLLEIGRNADRRECGIRCRSTKRSGCDTGRSSRSRTHLPSRPTRPRLRRRVGEEHDLGADTLAAGHRVRGASGQSDEEDRSDAHAAQRSPLVRVILKPRSG